MANDGQTFEEMIRSYNLTSEERARVEEQQNKSQFTADSLKEFITQMRIESAKEIVGKTVKEINYDELQVAWETVKDAQEGTDLHKIKVNLQQSSEAVMQAMQGGQSPLDMSTAPEISEWLAINNSMGNNANQQRNAQLDSRLNAFYRQFDNTYGLGNVSPATAREIAENQKKLETEYANFDPFAEENGQLKNPEFANSKAFYDNLTIENTDQNSDEVDKEAYKQQMIALARREAIVKLSVQPGFYALSQEERYNLFKKAIAEFMEAGCVSILINHAMTQMTEEQKRNPQSRRSLENQSKSIIGSYARDPKSLKVNNAMAMGTYAGRFQEQINVEKRIAQKTEVRGLWGRIKQAKKNFEKSHPKTAGVMKMLGNIGLTMGVNIVAGPAGLAALGAYRTCKTIREAIKERAQAEDKKKNLISYMFSNSKYRQKLIGSIAMTAFAGVGVYTGGVDANGLIGQGLTHGWSTVGENIAHMASGVVHGIAHPIDSITSGFGKLTSGLGSLKDSNIMETAKGMVPHDGLKITRILTTTGTFIDRMATKAHDAKKAGKKFGWGSAFLDAAVTAGTVFMTAHTHGHDDATPEPTQEPQEPTPEPTQEPPSRPTPHHTPHQPEPQQPEPQEPHQPEPQQPEPQEPHQPEPHQPEPQQSEPQPEEVRDESYYQKEKEALTPEGENSLKEEINLARKADGYTIEDAIDNKIDSSVAHENLSSQQGEEVRNYVKSEFDAADGEVDGKINDEDISRGDVRRTMNRVNDTLDSMRNNADEVLLAENLQDVPEFTDTPAEGFSHDTKSPDFYKGMSETIAKMQEGDAHPSTVMREAIQEGHLSAEQATVMNARYAELREEGYSVNKTLEIMQKDYDNEEKFWAAQAKANTPSELEGASNGDDASNGEGTPKEGQGKGSDQEQSDGTPKEGQGKGSDQEQSDGTPKEGQGKGSDQEQSDGTPKEGQDAAVNPKEAFEQRIEGIIHENSTIDLNDAENLSAGQVIVEKDKLGNMQIVGKDEDGNSFSMTTAYNLGPNIQVSGSASMVTHIDVPEDSPLYEKFHPNTEGMNDDEKSRAEMDALFAKKHYVENIFNKVDNHELTIVNSSNEGDTVVQSSETNVDGATKQPQAESESVEKPAKQTTGYDSHKLKEDLVGSAVEEIGSAVSGDELTSAGNQQSGDGQRSADGQAGDTPRSTTTTTQSYGETFGFNTTISTPNDGSLMTMSSEDTATRLAGARVRMGRDMDNHDATTETASSDNQNVSSTTRFNIRYQGPELG